MNARIATTEHRTRVLRALGVVSWQRRVVTATADNTQGMAAPMPDASVAVILPAGCAVRELDLLGRALSAFGPQLARAARIETAQAMQVPRARAYLVFGQAQAHALGSVLPAEAMRDAHIVLADTPGEVLAQASSKRRLWQALRNMRRALAAGG